MSLHQLSKETVHLLTTSQVITSVYSVVKELVENALDAKATSIEVKLENFGLNLIEIRDNGSGITRQDTTNMARPHFTSKLSRFQDLQSLEHYGFRGEALNSIAAVSDLSITTRTASDDIATTYVLDHSGNVTSQRASHLSQGTTVAVTNIFKNLPVRKQFYKSSKRCKEELKRVEDLLIGFGLTHCGLRLTLKHNKCLVWQKIQTGDFKSNVSLIFGAALFQQLTPVHYQCFCPMVKIRAFVPRPGADLSLVSRSTPDKIYLLVNQRCVIVKPIIQLLKRAYCDAFPSQSGRYPVAMVTISVPSADIDVNLEPNKTSVLLHNMEFILETVESLLTKLYSPSEVHVPAREGINSTGSGPGGRTETAAVSTTALPGNPRSLQTNERREVERPKQAPLLDRSEAPPTNRHDVITESTTCRSYTLQREAPFDSSDIFDSSDTRDADSHPQPGGIYSTTPAATSNQNDHSEFGRDVPPLRVQRSDGDKEGDGTILSRDELETFELLDIDEFENDSLDSLPEEIDPSELHQPATPVLASEAGPRGSSTLQFNQLTLSQWSRGEALKDTSGRSVEPVRILTSSGASESAQQTSTARQLPQDSKLVCRGPSPIYDMIHSRPVKRKASSPLESAIHGQGEAVSNAKKHKPLPSLLQKLIHEHSTSGDSVLNNDDANLPCQSLTYDFENISKRSNLRSSCPSTDASVVGLINPPGVWLVFVNGSIACFNTSTASKCLPLVNPPSLITRKEVELLLQALLSNSSHSEDINHCFHNLVKL